MEPTWRFEDYTIWIPQIDYDLYDDNIDIHVTLITGERYGATLFTLKNIQGLMDQRKQTGETNYGQYFWCPDMVVIRDLTDQTIVELITHLIDEDKLKEVFDRYE